MTMSCDDAGTEPVRRIEVFTGAGRRREWSDETWASILAESLFADETTAPVLDPGRGRTKTGQLWAYAREGRPWGGSDPTMVAYVYAGDRKDERPQEHLSAFDGILQVDGFSGYAALARRRQQIRLAFLLGARSPAVL